MPIKRKPAYTLHKPTGQARVRIDGRDHYLGSFGSPESRDRYDDLIEEWVLRNDVSRYTLTIDDLCLKFLDFAEGYYRRKDGTPTDTPRNIREALRYVVRDFGTLRVRDFGPRKLKAVRESMIRDGRCRTNINRLVQSIRRVFKWGVEEELVPPTVINHLLQSVGYVLGRVSEGSRNEYLASVAGSLRRPGLSRETILSALLVANEEKCDPPLPDDEVSRIASSIAKYDPEVNSLTSHISQEFPVLAEPALYGLPGEIVSTIDPYTEADPVATLVNVLAMFGNIIGTAPHFSIQKSHHHARINVVLVGATAKGRKGTSLSIPQYLSRNVDPTWANEHVLSGLSTGEGMIHAVSELGHTRGVEGRRLLIVEEEFATPLITMRRDGNTLSTVLRQSWDDGHLATMTRQNPLSVNDAHVSIIGHITADELTKHLTETHRANGFANRFLWVLVRRSKLLPNGSSPPESELQKLIRCLKKAVIAAKKAGELRRDSAAASLWESVYGPLGDVPLGITGAILGRAEPLVVRLSMIYALMDRSKFIKERHLLAALSLWHYCEQSTRSIFGESTGNTFADEIYHRLADGPLSTTDISIHFAKHKTSQEIKGALTLLESVGRVSRQQIKTKGRPKIVWRRIDAK